METIPLQPENTQKIAPFRAPKSANNEIISLEECKKYIGEFQLSDERILEIRNNMVGIIDSILNAYIENFE